MLLTVITALLCFAAAIIMLSPYFRKIPLLHPMAFYLIFEGAWQIFSYLITDLYPTSLIPAYVERVGTIVIILYYIFILFMTRLKSGRKKRAAGESRPGKKPKKAGKRTKTEKV